MPKRAAGTSVTVPLEEDSRTPLYRQLYAGLRHLILTGRLSPGTRLPSHRSLAADFSVSRNTVIAAVSQLRAEGFVESRIGAGTSVAATLPEDLAGVTTIPRVGDARGDWKSPLSARGRRLVGVAMTTSSAAPRPFRPSAPALNDFPIEGWARIASRYWRRAPRSILGYGDPLGYLALREAIAGYLGAARGVRCSAEQVAIVSGTQQALYLSAQVILDPGDVAWVEDPGYPSGRAALVAAGARLAPVPVDGEGAAIDAAARRRGRPRLIYTSPSNQFPLCVTMSLSRRIALLKFARRNRSWILEDDFDSEYRYAGRPIGALQGLDPDGRVLYVGTFSKTLFPSLRIGYVVLPPPLVEGFRTVRATVDRHSPAIEQAILTDFIVEGHFERHVRRMRSLYKERQEALLAAARSELAGLLDVAPSGAGINVVGWLPPGRSDAAAAEAAAAHGILVSPLSQFALRPSTFPRPGLLLSYGPFDETQIRDGIRRLARALERPR